MRCIRKVEAVIERTSSWQAECQGRVSETYADPAQWTKRSILNVANTGKFSTDRTIKQYADEIWGLKAVPVSFGN